MFWLKKKQSRNSGIKIYQFLGIMTGLRGCRNRHIYELWGVTKLKYCSTF